MYPSIVCKPDNVIFAVVPAITEVFHDNPAIPLSTYCFVAAPSAFVGSPKSTSSPVIVSPALSTLLDAAPVSAPVNAVDDTLVNPASVVLELPRLIAVVPTVTALFANLALAIDPANIVFVTVPVSPVVTSVPAVAGIVIAVVPAVAAGVNVIVPLVAPGMARLVIPVNPKLELARLRVTAVVPTYIVVLPKTALGSVPIKLAAVMFVKLAPLTAPNKPDQVPDVTVPTPVSDELTTVAFNVVPVNVPAAAVTVMSADPLNATPLIFLEVVNVAALPVVF